MKGVSIWSVAVAAALTIACGDRDMADSTATGADRTAAAGDASTPAAGTAGPDRTADRAPGATAPMARANEAADMNRFVEKMGQVGVAEVKLGELAAQRAANADVKQFGRRMVSDHQKANTELKQIASRMSVQLPTELDTKHQELYDRLSKLKGAAFDREYMKAMVDGHQEVAQELERHADSAAAKPGDRTVGTTGAAAPADASIHAWASKTLPDVRQHLEQARKIEDKLTQG